MFQQGSTLPVPLHSRLWLIVLVALVYIFLFAPLVVVIVISFSDSRGLAFPPASFSLRWYEEFIASPQWLLPFLRSLQAATLTAILVTPIAVLAAYSMRMMGGKISAALRIAVLAPQILPVVLLAIGIFFVYARVGLLNTMTGIVLAHCMFALPFATLPILSSIQSFDFAQEMAGRSLGAPRWKAFLLVTLPQLKGSVITGAFFAFAVSLEEVVIGLFISGGDNTLLSRRMFLSMRDQVDPTIAAISTLLLALTVLGGLLLRLLAMKPRRNNLES